MIKTIYETGNRLKIWQWQRGWIQVILYIRCDLILFAYVNKSGKNYGFFMVCQLIVMEKVISCWISVKGTRIWVTCSFELYI